VKDDLGNNLLHIAAIYGNNTILEYFIKNLKIEIFSRNIKGETALSIC
jgi:ankyrin repeat protein